MAALSADLKKLLARTKLAVLPEDYYLIHLPLDTRPDCGGMVPSRHDPFCNLHPRAEGNLPGGSAQKMAADEKYLQSSTGFAGR